MARKARAHHFETLHYVLAQVRDREYGIYMPQLYFTFGPDRYWVRFSVLRTLFGSRLHYMRDKSFHFCDFCCVAIKIIYNVGCWLLAGNRAGYLLRRVAHNFPFMYLNALIVKIIKKKTRSALRFCAVYNFYNYSFLGIVINKRKQNY
jgi:hypothetical protein